MSQFKSNKIEIMDFPYDVFPKSLVEFATSVMLSLGCNIDFVSVSMLVAAATAIGSKAKIKIKNDWTEGAVVFAIIIGEPGSKKTPAIVKALRPILKIQESFLEKISESMNDTLEAEEMPLKGKSIVTTDTTVEALSELMYQNLHGLLLYKDEAISWWKSMNQYKSKGGDVEFYLSVFAQTLLVINRKGKEKIQVNNPFLCFLGGLQVDLIESLSEMKDNGFIDRILFSYPKPIPIRHTNVELDENAKVRYEQIILSIYNSQIRVKDETQVFSFTEEGQNLWNEWHTGYCNAMDDASLPYYLRNVLSKLEGYTARFALILEFLKCAETNVEVNAISAESLSGAIKLTQYFISNVNKIRTSFASSAIDKKIDSVIAWLRKKGGYASVRQVYTHRVANLKTAQEVTDIFMEMKANGVGEFRLKSAQGDMFILSEKHRNNTNNQK